MSPVPPYTPGGGGAAQPAPITVSGQAGYVVTAEDQNVLVYNGGDGFIYTPDPATVEAGDTFTISDIGGASNLKLTPDKPLSVIPYDGTAGIDGGATVQLAVPRGSLEFLFEPETGWVLTDRPAPAVDAAPVVKRLEATLADSETFGDTVASTSNLVIAGGTNFIANPFPGEAVIVTAQVKLPAYAVTTELGQAVRIQRQSLLQIDAGGENSRYEEFFGSQSGFNAAAWTAGDLPGDVDYTDPGVLKASIEEAASGANIGILLSDYIACTPGTPFELLAHRRANNLDVPGNPNTFIDITITKAAP